MNPTTLYKSAGVLRYSFQEGYGHRLVMEVDRGIVDFYRALIPKWIKTNKQMYAPHVSVVRHEVPAKMEAWGKYEGQEVCFWYSNHVYNGQVYWWLNVFATKLEEIRLELGLPVSSPYTLPPEGFVKCFHMTIGNNKV